ncbi:TMEM165/GDT1 family protein [Natranaerobius thermophilus]|uniref:GDT1 family protein n=1 Tax=Natranaerobius thermophilus (strain ATCC BAA-1301 / DSM 18059 / JW/NM-WN-LF) TaxID=457570 RepID=B2A3M4_NATTJ|nr:TMEM165/GDT1 family protein [Natranaerobius thermophilus]ACB83650.1 protein of unknown function UPF0016 [Natranaerobius thermophilus JW/NM-WN-LF]
MLESFFLTFLLVFLAELGDKTQLATMLLATQKKAPVGVFLGASCALILSSLLGVTLGTVLTKFLPPNILKIGSGVAFVAIGIFLIFGPNN